MLYPFTQKTSNLSVVLAHWGHPKRRLDTIFEAAFILLVGQVSIKTQATVTFLAKRVSAEVTARYPIWPL